jgi:TIR domain
MNHVFLSYRHESDDHAKAVRNLGERLKAADLPVELDQFYTEDYPGGPDEGWRKWCEDRAEKSACVLIVCSKGWFDSYRKEGPPGKGLGAALEAAVFSGQIYDEKGRNARVRLVNLDNFSEAGIPTRLKDWHIFRLFRAVAEFDQMTKWIRQRLAVPGSLKSPPKVVFLAECAFDMQRERKKLQSFLEDEDWQVRPASKYDPMSREKALQADLGESIAFVQLLESYSRETGFDRQQREAAKLKPKFLFRDEKIALEEADEQHREFLTPLEVITGSSFDDFQMHVAAELKRLWEEQKPAPVRPSGLRKALVRVVIRSPNRESLWDEVFEWIDRQPDIRSHLLEEKEKLIDKYDPNVPCHGFLIVCDSSALDDERYSTDKDMNDCSLIQLKEKDESRLPPAGLVYFPPPPARWSRLQHVMPLRLHRISKDTPDILVQFFEDVRGIAK